MNACEKYAEWMTDAAVRELAPRREAELLAHAAECDACREAYRQTREMAAFVDRGVESVVAGEPSAHFASRLRARIAEKAPPRLHSRSAWEFRTAGAVAVAVLTVLIASYGWRRVKPEPVDFRAHANPARVGGAVVAARAQGEEPVRNGGRDVVAREDGAARRASRARLGRESETAREPKVLVPPGQLSAILQFARAVRAGQIDGRQLLAVQEESSKPLAIDPLGAAPLGPPQSDSAPEASPNERP